MTTKQLWDACRHLPCPTCRAQASEFCYLEVNGTRYAKHVPCLARIAAAREAS